MASTWRSAVERWSEQVGRRLELEVEPGRFLVAHCGTLLTEVLGVKRSAPDDLGGETFVMVDAGFHTLARPVLYGAYHRISVPGREGEPTGPRIVAGPLCESTDIFTQEPDGRPVPRDLPDVVPGEMLAIHDVGAYGAAMASCYNSRPLPAEVVIGLDGEPRLARLPIDPNEHLDREREWLAAVSLDP